MANIEEVKTTEMKVTVGEWYHDTIVGKMKANDDAVIWSSSNPEIAAVNATSGYVYGKSAGVATISAYNKKSGETGGGDISVEEERCITSISVKYTTLVLEEGETEKITLFVTPEDLAHKVVWYSECPQVASVDNNGYVTGHMAGSTTTIWAQAQDCKGLSASCFVGVKATETTAKEETPSNQLETSSKPSESTFADPVDVYSGAHTIKNTLMSLFGGQGLTLTAQYNSTKLCTGDIGKGWYHNFEKHVEGTQCEILVYEKPSSYIVFPVTNACEYTCSTPGKTGYVLTIDPTDGSFCVNCNHERYDYYNANGNFVKTVDHQGFETTIQKCGSITTLTDTVTGKKMYLEHTNGKLTRVYDDAQRETILTYTNDSLTNIRDVNGNSLTFTYDSQGRILSGTDSLGVKYFEDEYDDMGRVIKQKDGVNSHETLFTYDDDFTRTTTDRNSNSSKRVFNDDGLLTEYTDENGNKKHYSYDCNYNITKEVDQLGNSTKKEYNSLNKPTKIIDKNGNVTTFVYDTKGNVTKIIYPELDGVIPEETFVYNTRNQITSHTDLRGTVTVYTYDTNGLPLTKKMGNNPPRRYVYENGLLMFETDPFGDTIQYTYNTLGLLSSKTDPCGNKTSYEYDLSGNLVKTILPDNKIIINTYDGNYQKTSVTDANGNKTLYGYNGNMKNTVVTLPDNNVIRYEYDGEDRLTKVIDQLNNATVTQYDKMGRVISKQFPDNSTYTYEYDKVGNLIKETNPKGAVVEKTYDNMGNVLTVKDNDGNITRYQYDAMSRLVRKVNSVSGTTLYTYSLAGDLLCETDALGNKKTYTYDAYGNRLTSTDANGNTTSYTYDENFNLLSATDPLNNVKRYTYSFNKVWFYYDEKNRMTIYEYDGLGRQISVTDHKGNVFRTVYDGNGNVLEVIDAKGNKIKESTYNALNLPLTVKETSGKINTYTYNALGKVMSVTDSLNNKQEYTYNSRGQNTQVKDALNNLSSATYDSLGNITRLLGPSGSNIEYSYDTSGRLTSQTTTSGGNVTYTYNALNLKEQLTNGRGQVRKYFYDALGRIIGYVGEEDSVSYTYDANSNVLTVTDKNGTVTRTYDALNRVSTCTDTFGKTVSYSYDEVGNLVRVTYPDNTSVTYSYDENNNLSKVTDWAGRVTTYTYDQNNKVTGVVKPDGSVTTTVYDTKQRVTSTIERTSANNVITGYEYTYDDLGRISTETYVKENIKKCYTYDSLSRVTVCTTVNLSNNTQTSQTYTYSAQGNITDDSSDDTFSYDTNNRLVSYNSTPVTYDEDGNMLFVQLDCCEKLQLEYDSQNRLLKAGNCEYTYNAENTRIKNLCDGNETTYTYNTNAKLSQLLTKTTNGVVTKYVYGLGLIGEEKQGYYRVYHFDLRGSTVAITNINGTVTDTFKYDTYGKLVERTGSTFVIFGYNGRDGVITDKNGLIYMRSRYYSPILKRFVNADILHGSISDSTSLNRYSYVNGNPIFYVDPFGLSKERGGPTALEAAYMANHIYRATNKDVGKQLEKVYGGWVLCDIIVDENGFKIGVYSRTTVDGKTEYTLVNKGSTTVSDWINNAQQPFGLSKDMAESIQIAKEFVEEHADAHITFVGHSKGGGEAESMALATNKDAILFNPAKANYLKYDVSGLNYDANMTSYVIEGEVLSSAYYAIDMLPAFEPLSKATTFTHDNFLTTTVPDAVNMSPFLGERVLLPNPSGNTITDHSMASVIKVLWGEGYE